MGEAVLAGLFVLGAGADAEVDVDDGDLAVDVEKEIEAVRKGGAVDSKAGLGGSQQGDEEGQGSEPDHRAHVIARRVFGDPQRWLTGADHAATRDEIAPIDGPQSRSLPGRGQEIEAKKATERGGCLPTREVRSREAAILPIFRA